MKNITIVIPIYNEKENIKILFGELNSVLQENFTNNYEIIFVDDGSYDGSFDLLKELRDKNENVKLIKFRKNFGQTAALDAGFTFAEGKVIVTLDGDLQNDPKDIPKVFKLTENFDVVNGWRHKRQDPLSKKIFSRISNFITRKVFGLGINDLGCSLKAYRREAVNNLRLYGEMHRFIPVLAHMKGFSVGEVKVNHRKRKFGQTKYNFKRIFKGAMDMIFLKFWGDFSSRPLHFFGFIGLLGFALSFLIVLYKVGFQFLLLGSPLESGPLLLLSVLLFLSSLIFVMLGFLGEIQIRQYYESSDNKAYIIEEVL